MPEETPVTAPEPVAEQPTEAATPPVEEPKAEPKQDPKDEPDWRAAYTGLQRNLNRAHQRTEDVLKQNAELVSAVKMLKEGQSAMLKQTLGEDEAKRFEAEQERAAERAAALQAAQGLERGLKQAVSTMDGLMAASGLSQEERMAVYAQAKEYDGPQWFEAVYAIASQRIAKATEERIRKAQEGIQAKTKAEILAEAEAIAQQKSKESDRIDVAKGSGPTSLADRIRNMDVNSEEFKKFERDVLAGRMT